MLDLAKSLLPELVKQMPVVVALFIILIHQQQQINLLLEACIMVSQQMP